MTMKNPKSFLKWVGGKTRLMKKLEEYIPDNYNTYYEPFLGGGSVFFNFTPKNAVISDLNKTLIDTYITIRDDFDELFKHLQDLEKKNTSENFYKYREEFNNLRSDEKKILESKTYISALMIYLNKTGYGGVYRENQKGGFNVPYGNYKNINITDRENLLKVKESLNNVNLSCSYYSNILKKAEKGDFIYLDPPYHKESKTSFTKYQKGDFDEEEQKKLASFLKKLDKKGVMFLLSNSNTAFINEIYKDFTIVEVTVGRHINNKNKGSSVKSKKNNEVLIFNYSIKDSDKDSKEDSKKDSKEDSDKDSGKDSKEEKENEIELKKKTFLNLLKNQEVIDWATQKGKWLNVKQNNKEDNKQEKEWGNLIISQVENNQWTTNLGETILKEVLLVLKGKVWRPKTINNYKPDWETEDGIYEAKTRNWTTSGTAGEKILGTPYKYSDIPIYYGKPLYIVTIAYQEYEAIKKFELFDTYSKRKIKMIKEWKDMDIQFIKFSDLLKKAKII